jgi:transposase
MPAPLSKETRQKIVHHKENGEKESDIAKWLCVSESAVTKIWKLYKTKNTVKTMLHKRGRKPAFGVDIMDKIVKKIGEQPDITLEELVDEFGLGISISALSRKLAKLDLTFKKRLYLQKNNNVKMSKNSEQSG